MKSDETDANKCSICGGYGWPDGSHNAQPVNNGRCCGICNVTTVIPMRLQRMADGRDPREVLKD